MTDHVGRNVTFKDRKVVDCRNRAQRDGCVAGQGNGAEGSEIVDGRQGLREAERISLPRWSVLEFSAKVDGEHAVVGARAQPAVVVEAAGIGTAKIIDVGLPEMEAVAQGACPQYP